jgi:hypothetical protein
MVKVAPNNQRISSTKLYFSARAGAREETNLVWFRKRVLSSLMNSVRLFHNIDWSHLPLEYGCMVSFMYNGGIHIPMIEP